MGAAAHLRIATLNTWGAPYARHRRARMQAIAGQLLAMTLDAVCLQEIFLPQDRRMLMEATAEAYPHQVYFASSAIGSGLLILSRYPVQRQAFHRYSLAGKPQRLQHGDYYVQKGIGLAVLETPLGSLALFNTHTHAQYLPDEDNEYAAFTGGNLYEAAQFIQAQALGLPVVLCGDLNVTPNQVGYALLSKVYGLVDAYAALHPGEMGYTFRRDNPYVGGNVDQRLDYVFLRDVQAESTDIAFDERLIGECGALALSDHVGLVAELRLGETARPLPDSAPLEALLAQVVLAQAQAEAAYYSALDRALLGVGLALDAWVTARPVWERLGRWGRLGRRGWTILSLAYGLLSLGQARFIDQPLSQTFSILEGRLREELVTNFTKP